jgi:hypothetical protein
MTLWLQAPIFQKRLEFPRDFLVAWDVRVLIAGRQTESRLCRLKRGTPTPGKHRRTLPNPLC